MSSHQPSKEKNMLQFRVDDIHSGFRSIGSHCVEWKPLLKRTLALLLVVACQLSPLFAEEVTLGIWSWKQGSISTASARRELLDFCKEEGITHIDQHVSIQRTDDLMQVRNAGKLERLLREARDAGVTVSALVGDRKMFFAERHSDNLEKLSAIVEFNRRLPIGVSLLGIKYDVEPYLTEEWKAGGDQRERVIREYLDGLTQIRQWLTEQNSKLELAVDIPFWWDKPELEINYDQKRQALTHHIQDRVDLISIMSYRRSAVDVLRLSEQELAFARKQRRERSVTLGLSFNPEVGAEAVTTFAGHPQSVFRSTVAALREQLADEGSVRCVMLHDYRYLRRYLEQPADSGQ